MDTRVVEIEWNANRAGAVNPTPGLLEEANQRPATSADIAELKKEIAALSSAKSKVKRQTPREKNVKKLSAILAALKPGDDIPTLRRLCSMLGVTSKNTVKAYLRELGIDSWEDKRHELISRQGAGHQ